MGAGCSTIKMGRMAFPRKTTLETTTPIGSLAIDKKLSSTEKKARKKSKRELDDGTIVVGSVPLYNSRINLASTHECLEDMPKFASIHLLTEENVDIFGTTPRASEDSMMRKTSQFNKGPLIGKGPCSEVYECLNLKTGELVAIKEIRLQGDINELKSYVETVKKENALFRSLNHPNIVKCYETKIMEIKDQNHLLIGVAAEYVPGGSIKDLLNKFKTINEKVVMIYMRQILDGLSYLHKMGIIHKNLKGSNILIDASGTVKLTDFGSLKLDHYSLGNPKELKLTLSSIQDSLNWLAPEVITTKNPEKASDVWSLGCVALEMLTGLPPWSNLGKDLESVAEAINSGDLPPFPNGISETCHDFLQKTLKLRPEDRPSIDELFEHPFVRDVTPVTSYMESDTLLSSVSGRQNEISRSILSHDRHISVRTNDLRVQVLENTPSPKNPRLIKIPRRGYPVEYVKKNGITLSPPEILSAIRHFQQEEIEPPNSANPVILVNVQEAPPEDECTPAPTGKQFFPSKLKSFGENQSLVVQLQPEEKDLEKIKAEMRRQIEEEMMRELEQGDDIMEKVDEEVEKENNVNSKENTPLEQQSESENALMQTITTDQNLLQTGNIITCFLKTGMSVDPEPHKEAGGSAESRKSLDDEIKRKFAEIKPTDSRVCWNWEKENGNEINSAGVTKENQGGHYLDKDMSEYISIVDSEEEKDEEEPVCESKNHLRTIIPAPALIRIGKRKNSDGKSDHGLVRQNSTNVLEVADDEGGIRRQDFSVRFDVEIYRAEGSRSRTFKPLEPYAIELKQNEDLGENEEKKERINDYDSKQNRSSVYMS